ncbi:MAG: helicase-related protein [archaeon]
MNKVLKIPDSQSDPVLNIIENTLKMKKQAIVFVNTKRGAESQAERIAGKIIINDEKLNKMSEEILKALPSPTKQCRRLAACIKKGSAFHHAGLATKQRELIEDGFRSGLVRVICATPTLAMGVDLPAFRVIVRDLKRYGGSWGMTDIPVLEYEQQAGRAGRPGKEDYGEAICIAKTEAESDKIFEKYVEGESEEIYSKLAVEPVLRAHILSLVASEFVTDRKSLFEFFDKTFYAHQYADLNKLHKVLEKITGLLNEWEFIKISGGSGDFVSADAIDEETYEATMIGKRVSELYLDPLTANFIITCLRKATSQKTKEFSYLQMVARTLEIRPLLRVKVAEYEDVQDKMASQETFLLDKGPTQFDEAYDEFLNSIKTALFFQDWIDEKNEEFLLEKFSATPGEVHAKLAIADWLLYSTTELARMLKFQQLMKDIAKVRLRLKYGAKTELLPLLKLKNIGRVRARKMFNHKVKTLTDIKNVDITTLAQLIGKATAISVKKQMGQEYDPKKIEVKENKRKGQISLKDYQKKNKK